MFNYPEFLTFLAALFAIMNPIGAVPIFIGLTGDRSLQERRRTALVTPLAVAIILLISAAAGNEILSFFGISVASFRIAGGLIILLMAIAMLHSKQSHIHHTPEEHEEAKAKDSVAIVPLAIPLLGGPGSIATVIVYVHHIGGVSGFVTVGAGVIVICALLIVLMQFATPLAKILGQTGINIATRIMGIILAAIAIEMLAAGLKGVFPSIG